MNTQLLSCVLCLLIPASRAFAEDLPTILTERGKLLLNESFAEPVEVAQVSSLTKLTHGWRLKPGKWEFVNGALKGAHIPAEMHSAVSAYVLKFQDAVIQFDARLDGCKKCLFRLNDSEEHICRVLLTDKGLVVQKDDHDHEGPDVAVPLGAIALSIAPGEWKTVLLEIRGEEVVVTIDGRSVGGSHPLIATEKANLGFGVTGDSASFRNLRIWEALPNPNWPANKSKLSTDQPKLREVSRNWVIE